MNTILARTRKTEEGSSLFLVMTLIVIAFLMLASALSWSQNNALTIARNSQYWRTVAAAEAATEKVLARINNDFQLNGEGTVYNNSQGTAYCTAVPTAADGSYWSSYVFSDGQGRNNQTYVALVPGTRTNWTVLNSQYAGLSAIADTYQIVSYARDSQGQFNVSAGVQQTIQPSTIPLFQFAIFYNVDLEIDPGPNMTVTGRVHSNANIYEMPDANLTYQSDITASGNILVQHAPGDPQTDPGGGTIVWPGTGDKTNFGYTMKYTKNLTNVQGSLLLIRHRPDGSIYRVKSNSLGGLSIGQGQDLTVPMGWASFTGKATYLQPGWIDPVGNYSFIVYVEDRNQPGTGFDRFWVQIKDGGGNVVGTLSISPDGPSNAQSLTGGNIVVPHR